MQLASSRLKTSLAGQSSFSFPWMAPLPGGRCGTGPLPFAGLGYSALSDDAPYGVFSSQVESLGGSENTTKQKSSVVPVNEREREPHDK
jgi:hypothetical protein